MFPKPAYLAALFLFAAALLNFGGWAFAFHSELHGEEWSTPKAMSFLYLIFTSDSPHRMWFVGLAILLFACVGLGAAYLAKLWRVRSRAIAMLLVTIVLSVLGTWINMSFVWLFLAAIFFAALCVSMPEHEPHGA